MESNEVANYCFPKTRPKDREIRARIIGDWLKAEARFLAWVLSSLQTSDEPNGQGRRSPTRSATLKQSSLSQSQAQRRLPCCLTGARFPIAVYFLMRAHCVRFNDCVSQREEQPKCLAMFSW